MNDQTPNDDASTQPEIAGKMRIADPVSAPSIFPNHNPSPFGASWRWSPKRSIPRLQCSGGCGCSNPPFRPTVPGSSRRQPAPGAHWHRKPSIEPRTVALWARCIAPFFVLDENGVLPRNRWERNISGQDGLSVSSATGSANAELSEQSTKGFCMSAFNVFTGDSRGSGYL